ncbi:MAG: phenylacetate--CoA ligase family protein [Hyphomicrobium sp.]|uniref:phenylacetate--CoA ligase family protein n=1 Tax=Hyphomicrobium sp. TaxID=82 RepID=UPI001320F764|nr:phenylacetate--CoA ligase family protein [Hyphomicrobium sp.]KAB2942313.1 MAG: phenylacetate--CoA ligase family protein [Hyphomicrobium sp.]MBZ0209244.1 phenylacetate--CoA ligase family protein [Hyphomicrobium sp.]
MTHVLLPALRGAPASPQQEKTARQQRARLAEMVAHARACSPYYRELYQGLPERVEDPTLLPVTHKKALVARFEDWVADRDVTLDKVQRFIGNPALIGEKFLDKYVVATTSGTTGTPGIFVLDDRHVSLGMTAVRRAFGQWLSVWDWVRILARGMRTAALHATGGHYASVGAVTRMQRSSRIAARQIRQFSVHTPLPQLVAELNGFRPALLTGYATVTSLLAGEREAGRLRINPVLVVVTAEGLPQDEYGRMARVFGAKVGNVWGSTEMPAVAYSCAYGWLHVMEDWLIVEPVHADYRPTPAGEQSHTVLISNLANRVQPILRYDLGDRILVRPDACPCGNPQPAVRIEGRSGDVLNFETPGGERVSLPPLALELDDIPGIEVAQVVQTTPASLRVRLLLVAGSDPDRVWQAAHDALVRLLAEHKLEHVTIERAEEPPEQSKGGKFRQVIPLS